MRKEVCASNTSANEKDTVPTLQNQPGEKNKPFLREEEVHLPLPPGDVVDAFFSSHFGKPDVPRDL